MKSTEKDLLYTEKQRLIALCEEFNEMNELEKAEKLSGLFLKVVTEEFAVAFCGHFSAGKSSLINALSNTGILPASPIPTSANIVKMKKGKPKAIVHLKNKEVVTFKYPYDIEEIKSLCKDAELVESIEIYYEAEGNTANIAFYDTPGIDSTDPAHKKATENVVYLADLIFYVMDYNHILSETNIEFIQSLIEKGKSVRLIINQVDKHREEELSFQAFKENVFKAFQSYGIDKEQIFFTSVKSPSLSNNDLSALVAYLKKIEMNVDHLLKEETNKQLIHYIYEYIENQEKDKNDLSAISSKLDQLNSDRKSLLLQAEGIEKHIKEKEESIRSQFLKIVDSAQLMPYETREKAGLFIESTKKEFKVGFLFSKQKTEQERDQRKAAFQEKLQESIDAHINWHAENLINTLQKEFQTDLPQWKPVKLKEETLFSHVQAGLSSQGQGLLNYCDSVSGEAKKIARQQMSNCIKFAMTLLNEENDEVSDQHQNQEYQIEKEIAVLTEEKEEAIIWDKHKNELLSIISSDPIKTFSIDEYAKKCKAQFNDISIEEFKSKYSERMKNINSDQTPVIQVESPKTEAELTSSLQVETDRLYHTAHLLQPLSGLTHLADEMESLAKRLENRSYTCVLFGAFSAGKSSFANALFGEAILPSSPNPTTAAINEIRKPDKTHQHGTVMIEMKTKEEVLFEINALVNKEHKDLSALMKSLKDDGTDEQNKHIAAFLEGYEWANESIGKVLQTDLTEIKKYAAVESKACFVRKIIIFYSCPLTEMGLVLVDTPGANSIHSRHTEVAFEYMKHADIIIYLTYFNHAFSYADREFLIQLGRIKDTFSSDKMFFAINASDLANSEKDKLDVVNHVKGNLQTFGIRNPRLFPVSSKEELSAADRSNSGFKEFTDSLFDYIEIGLEQSMIKSAEAFHSHVKHVVQNMIAETKLRLQKEDDYLSALQNREDVLNEYCNNNLFVSMKQFNQEKKELLFYIKQRVLIRYHDFYKETIHPAAVQSSKSGLHECLGDLSQKLIHDLNQEFRACSLRLDKWLQNNITDKEEKVITQSLKYQVNLQKPIGNPSIYKTPSLSKNDYLKAELTNKEWLTYFKNAKHFFEQSGSNELKNDLAKVIETEVEQWIESAAIVLEQHYTSVIESAENESKGNLSAQLTKYFNELKKPGDLQGKIKKMQTCLDQMQ